MTTSNVSTAVKIMVSMVVVAALVATRFSSTKVRLRSKYVQEHNVTDSAAATENVHLDNVMQHVACGMWHGVEFSWLIMMI
jgi:hypothetical protein